MGYKLCHPRGVHCHPFCHPLVLECAGQSVTTSLAIAEGVGNPHSTVIKLIRQNASDLEEFGPLGFEIQVGNRPQGGGAKTEYATLNEQQSTLLLRSHQGCELNSHPFCHHPDDPIYSDEIASQGIMT